MDYTPINSIPYEQLKVGTQYVFNHSSYLEHEREGILFYKKSINDIGIQLTKNKSSIDTMYIAYTRTYLNNVRPVNTKLDILYCFDKKFKENIPLTSENIEELFSFL